jgi:integrase
MASIDKRSDGTYRARWREYPGGPQKTKSFRRKVDANDWLVKVQHELRSGVYVDPVKARTTLDDYSEPWLRRMRPSWRPATYKAVEISVRRHIVPTLGSRPLSAIRRPDIEAWAASLDLAPSTVATVRKHLGQILTAAVEDGLIPRNPAIRARMPRAFGAKPKPVAPDVVEALALAVPSWFRVAIPLGLGAGLRQGETCGLTVDQIDFLRRTLRVDRKVRTLAGHPPALEAPKTKSSFRTIPLAGFVVDALAAHLAEHGAGDSGVVLHWPDGGLVDSNRFGYAWRAARRKVGVPDVDYHDLRHTFASTLLSHGVSVKAVSEWLGHASPVVTLTTYAHLMPQDDDRARAALDGAFRAEDNLRTTSDSA